uniref:Interleukin-12 receptor subunit beta-2 isoform X1 n=2 Tax=Pogona vitticeps TaxID=103695 RepID=A0ABM5G882_9SAUR
MTDFIKTFFTGNVPLTVWLLVHMGFGASCRRLKECRTPEWGYMNVSDGSTFMLHGSTVTLHCSANSRGNCSAWKLGNISILLNDTAVNSSNSLSVSARVSLHTPGKQTFTCRCSDGKKSPPMLICGIYIFVGIPPEWPRNVSCNQYGKNGSTTCSWIKGRDTYLPTSYTLQLTNGTFLEEIGALGNLSSVDLKVNLDPESTYTVVVIAKNELGNASSQPIQFTLIDIVKPYSPVNLSVKFDGFTATSCTVLWHDEQESQRFSLRYQPVHSNSWHMLQNISTRRYDLHGLKPNIEYKFQVSSRFLSNRGLWSDWSVPFQIEAGLFSFHPVPSEPTDIWYLQKDASPEMQNITLFWKATNMSQQKQKSHYKVTFQALNQMDQSVTETNSTVYTVFSRLIPRTNYNITICSYNSRGMSHPVSITAKVGMTDLPLTNHLSATSVENGSIIVTWEAPLASSLFISEYVVEWAEHHDGNSMKTHSSWLKVCGHNFTVTIENLKPNVCYQISVFALYQSRAGKAASTTGNVSAKAPLTGPHINTTVKDGRILVSWREIPPDEQMGCIVSYKIYLQKQAAAMLPDIYNITTTTSQPFPIKNIQTGAEYAVWMTASTMAGESPNGNEEIIYIQNAPDWGPILSICIMALLVCACCVPSARRKLLSLFRDLPYGLQGKGIPDPANSSWAKEVKSKEDEAILHPAQFLDGPNTFEEPETLQIEEVFIKRQYQDLKDVPYCRNTRKREKHNYPTGTILQEEYPTVKSLDYDPLSIKRAGNTDMHQPPSLYKKVVPGEPNQGQVFSEYLVNQLEDVTIDYLPNTVATTMNNDENSNDSEFNTLFVSTRTFIPQTFSFDGKLTLDAIRMDCISFKD